VRYIREVTGRARDTVRVVSYKYDGSLHWHYRMRRLGEDEYGVWLGGQVGTEYRRGRNISRYLTAEPRVKLLPRGAWWSALFLASPNKLEIYCDVGTPVEWAHAGEVRTVDLDLDVCRYRDGGADTVVDEDEFAMHQKRYGYPADVIASARAAAKWLESALGDGTEPFAGRFHHWFELCG
jgi:hypothetical protein